MKAKYIKETDYWLENGKVYDVKEYKKDKTCFEVILGQYRFEIFSKHLFEVVDQSEPSKKTKSKFSKKYLDKIFDENNFETPNDVYEFLLSE